jgi:hypothetical protein
LCPAGNGSSDSKKPPNRIRVRWSVFDVFDARDVDRATVSAARGVLLAVKHVGRATDDSAGDRVAIQHDRGTRTRTCPDEALFKRRVAATCESKGAHGTRNPFRNLHS